jgi:hypothetical protein
MVDLRREMRLSAVHPRFDYTNNFWVQIAALVIVTVVVIALAAKYIW